MSTRHPTSTDEERELALEAAAIALQRARLVVIPTDTVYGIAADAFDEEAVKDLLMAKGRGRAMPPPVLVSAATTLDALTVKVPSWARELVARFWPGALTLVCHAQSSLQWDLGDTRGTVAVRMPDHAFTLEVIERTGPLAVSSANLTGQPAATDADRAEEMLGEVVEVVVDDGPSPGGAASTILDVTQTPGRLLREGAISRAELNAVLEPLGVAIPSPDASPDASPDHDSDRPVQVEDAAPADGAASVGPTPSEPAEPAEVRADQQPGDAAPDA